MIEGTLRTSKSRIKKKFVFTYTLFLKLKYGLNQAAVSLWS